MKKKLILTFSLFCFAFVLSAQTAHWITFVDTDDSAIGELNISSKKLLTERFFNVINKELRDKGYRIKTYDNYSGNYSSVSCRNIVDNIICDSSDIILFYYIGHGYRSQKTSRSAYPLLAFSSYSEQSIPLAWLHNSLKEKNPMLLITIGVCSNIIVNHDNKLELDDIILQTDKLVEDCDNDKGISSIAHSFINYSGDIIVCSASPGQDSWGVNTSEGPMDLFSYQFISTFEKAIVENNFSWASFWEEVADETYKVSEAVANLRPQKPVFSYNLKGNKKSK